MTTEVIFLMSPDPDGGYTARALGYPIFTDKALQRWPEIRPTVETKDVCQSYP